MKKKTSIKTTARIAGFLYLLQIPLGIFGMVYVPKVLMVPWNPEATASNIMAHEDSFRLSIVSAILCALVTIATAQYLYQLLKPVNKQYAKWILMFTMIVAPISMINELNHMAVLLLLKNHGLATSLASPQGVDLMSVFLDLHNYGLHIVGIFFGLWLLPMGYLVFKSGYIPKVIGVFLLITCLGYLIDFAIFFLNPGFAIAFSDYTWPGEVMMVLWLLIKGVNIEKFERRKQMGVV